MSENYSEKSAIFIDGGYLNKILKSYFNGVKINYLQLSNKICSDLKLNRLRTYFYYCLPIVRKNNTQDLKRREDTQKFLTELKII